MPSEQTFDDQTLGGMTRRQRRAEARCVRPAIGSTGGPGL